MSRVAPALALAIALALAPGSAQAFTDFAGARALGMGGAGRADARANEGPLLNPSGMSLGRLYNVDAAFQLITRDGGQTAHIGVMDSTSAWRIAGGAYYTLRRASPAGVPVLTGHEVGLALSFPLGERAMLGATAKYLYLSGGAPEADGASKHNGFTADVGLTVRALSNLTVGVVGYNLHDLGTARAPVALGYGVALLPTPELTIVADGFHDFTPGDDTRGVELSVGGGVELAVAQKLAPRLGGGYDGRLRHGYVTAGFATISELGAAEVGLRQDVSGGGKLTYLGVGLRLFVPQP
jgi:hypothetical protein